MVETHIFPLLNAPVRWRHSDSVEVSKETYCSVKRDLLQCQKRPITVSKEIYYNVKREHQ
jgi:hypothetical protein